MDPLALGSLAKTDMETQILEALEEVLAGRSHGCWRTGRELFPCELSMLPVGRYRFGEEEELYDTITYTGPSLSDEDHEEVNDLFQDEGYSFYSEEMLSPFGAIEVVWTRPLPEYVAGDWDED